MIAGVIIIYIGIAQPVNVGLAPAYGIVPEILGGTVFFFNNQTQKRLADARNELGKYEKLQIIDAMTIADEQKNKMITVVLGLETLDTPSTEQPMRS